MLSEHEQSYWQVVQMLSRAFTREEVEAARNAAREHLRRYPDDIHRDIWHGFGTTVMALEEREEQSRLLGLSPKEHAKREALLLHSDVRADPADAASEKKIAQAEQNLQQWLNNYPDDSLLRSRLASLKVEREIIETCRSASSHSSDTPSDAELLIHITL